MEENLDQNKVNDEISNNNSKTNYEVVKESVSDKVNDIENNSKTNSEIVKETVSDKVNNIENNSKTNSEVVKETVSDKVNDIENNSISQKNPTSKVEIKKEINKPVKTTPKPKKEPPIEKKPFQEFINVHLIPALIEEINQRGLEIINIDLKNTNRPIAGDKCWVINCEIKDTCIFWLSFEKDDISSLKSISLSKPNQKPSIIESFLIDEKRITLKLIVSRVLQRLNGQKLIGVN